MKKSLQILSFLLILILCGFTNAQQQDVITLKKIEVYGQQYTSNVTLYKNAPVNIKVSYSVLKQTASHTNIASSAYFVADMATGSPLQIHVHSGPGFPINYGQSGDYEFYTQVQNASMLIKSANSGNLYLRLTSSAGGVIAYSNKFNTTFSNPTVTNNTISGGGLVEYMGTGPYIAGSIPTIMPPGGTVKYYWQKRMPWNPASSSFSWTNINVNSLNYIPSGTVNMTRYFIRRAVQTEHFGTFFSNEVEVKVNIGGNNLELKVDETNSLYIQGYYPGGGDGLSSMTYQWQEKINSVWTNITTDIGNRHKLMIPSTAVPKYYRRVVSSPGVADNISNEIVINPGIYGNAIYKTQNPTLGVVYEGEKIMPGHIPQMSRLVTYMFDGHHYSTEDPMTFQWQKKEVGGTWQDITGATSEIFNVDTPLYVDTEFRRKSSTPNLGDNYSNPIIYVISQLPGISNNNIQFDSGNVQNIMGSIPTGGDGNFEYHWVVDTLPDESIGAIPAMVNTQNSTIDGLASTYPMNMDEYYFTRYVVSDGVWQPSNTIKYSYTNGILLKQALQAKNLKMSVNGPEKKILVMEDKGEVVFNFKNYSKDNVQIYLTGLNGMQSEKIITTTIDNDNFMSSWRIPLSYLPGVYLYKVIFSNGEVKNGKVVLKK
ncbi:hypothetical protein [Chryseobacterium kwangjuense]|uniref:Secretion system C-terminal sorting domain-containing protein n=1 Tax=Chryseobacterium kwangjuense TaxID=267125 RepID=A0A135WI12_9FLAO|nr:hypothetical protein [Chryseobacterium kwangjuense]KXH84556.1 hypothetical protein AU378_01980 [Chryseobacterium kwangjuense]